MFKTLTFALLHFSVAFAVTYLLTGSIGISSAVALIEPLANTVVFYFHEKAWRHYEQKQTTPKSPPTRTSAQPCCGHGLIFPTINHSD
ncbi:MAG: DUF2061 domain-containing protein [Moraxella sp.]|nr:DUF2061 domain-containing protein [Moraxella sp.]